MPDKEVRVALFLLYLGGGGAERAMLNIASGLADRGIKVDFVLASAGGDHMWRIPSRVRIIDLKASDIFHTLTALVSYLRREQPTAMLSALHYTNEVAIWAKYLARVSTRIVVCEQNTLSSKAKHEIRLRKRLTPFFVKLLYPWADEIVAVSKGVANDLNSSVGLHSKQIRVIYNPAITPEIAQKAQEPIQHEWFTPGSPPVILGVGKLEKQKDFSTLIRAFALVRKKQPCRLMILGWGPDRDILESLVCELGIENDTALPGYVNNPYMYMARSTVFALSSAWEGLPFVLVEAMSLGIPVVSTDCPSGPREILNNGRYGWLTPVGDSEALALSIESVLAGHCKAADPAWLEQFTVENVTRQYMNAFKVEPSRKYDPYESFI